MERSQATNVVPTATAQRGRCVPMVTDERAREVLGGPMQLGRSPRTAPSRRRHRSSAWKQCAVAAVVGLFATGTVGSVDIGTVAAAPVQIRPLAVFNAPVNGDLALLSDDGSTAVVLQEDAGQFEMIAVDVASGTTRSLGTGNFWGMKSLSTDGSRVLVRLDFAPGRATILDTTDGTVTWQSAPGVDVYDAVMSDDASTVAVSVLLPSGAIHRRRRASAGAMTAARHSASPFPRRACGSTKWRSRSRPSGRPAIRATPWFPIRAWTGRGFR